jgi:AcrR family transcriptional regulator
MSEDRRVRRTQKLLKEALIAEALEKGYKNITIQDVTTRADVGYRTYFRHYSGLDELLVRVAKDRLDRIYEILDLPQLAGLAGNPVDFFHRIGGTLFQHIQENQTNLRLLLLDESMGFVFDPVLDQAILKLETFLSSLPATNLPPSLAAHHIIASVFSLIRWWLENDLHPSPEEMGNIFSDLVIKPTWLAMTGPESRPA